MTRVRSAPTLRSTWAGSADEQRELWDQYCAGPYRGRDGPLVRVWSFGYICMLMADSIPEVVGEYLDEHDPENMVQQYLDNMRRARREGRL